MDAEIKAKWVEALRSGEYQQARTVLRSLDDKFCCLGVLCQIVEPDRWVLRTSEKCHSVYGVTSVPPEEITDPVGLDNAAIHTLWQMNDGDPRAHIAPRSFAEIADYIEKTL